MLTFPSGDEILSLPGWDGPLPSRQFSGYLDLPGSEKHIHYWLVESESSPDTDPITVWLNGGPGCSSLDGLFYEHGPMRFNPQNTSELIKFEYTWAKQSNILYIEAPVGVGFSYSGNVHDYQCTDDTTAVDNMHALEQFFQLFPDFSDRDFYITGESYGGIYVPTLAEAILKKGSAFAGPPLKGIAVGNGCVGSEIGVCGNDRDFYQGQYFATSTALLGTDLQEEILNECNFDQPPNAASRSCRQAISKMSPLLNRINTYDVYGQCISYNPLHDGQKSKQPSFKAPGDNLVGGPTACINSIEASNYLQRDDVVKAIHTISVPDWAVCNTARGWSYRSTRTNLARDTYPFLISKIRVVIYNGDFDACVPWTDNLAWTKGMGFNPTHSWHPWTYTTKNGAQIGGYANHYGDNNDFTFTTIRGGRHEVPETAPEAAFEMLHRLLSGKRF